MKSVSLTVLALAMVSSAEAGCLYAGDGTTSYDDGTCPSYTKKADCNASPPASVCGWLAPNCGPGYSLDLLDVCVDNNECTTGANPCGANSACANTAGSFTCSCLAGFDGSATGTSCTDIDECSGANNCATGGRSICLNSIGSFSCSCAAGYTGDGVTCNDVNECSSSSTNNCHASAACSNSDGGFSCQCNSGYTGDGISCSDDNECTDNTHNCDPDATCGNTGGSFTCTCNSGFQGDGLAAGTGCTDIDDCSNTPCQNGATCTDTAVVPHTYTCACAPGYDGSDCENDIDECALYPCDDVDSAATCTDAVNGRTCSCGTNYFGVDCETHTCPAGQHANAANDGCYDCDDGTARSTPGATSHADCIPCTRCFSSNSQHTACNHQLNLPCEQTPWTAWGSCSATCSEGTSVRTRTTTATECHAGTPCAGTTETKECLDQVCDCQAVFCNFEQHSCTDYSAIELLNGKVIANGDYHTNVGTLDQYLQAGMTGQGKNGTPDTWANRVENHHDATIACSNDWSVRVHHDRAEPTSLHETPTTTQWGTTTSTGHHCKYTATGDNCHCKCHASFHHGYNPKTEDTFIQSCGQGEVDDCGN